MRVCPSCSCRRYAAPRGDERHAARAERHGRSEDERAAHRDLLQPLGRRDPRGLFGVGADLRPQLRRAYDAVASTCSSRVRRTPMCASAPTADAEFARRGEQHVAARRSRAVSVAFDAAERRAPAPDRADGHLDRGRAAPRLRSAPPPATRAQHRGGNDRAPEREPSHFGTTLTSMAPLSPPAARRRACRRRSRLKSTSGGRVRVEEALRIRVVERLDADDVRTRRQPGDGEIALRR